MTEVLEKRAPPALDPLPATVGTVTLAVLPHVRITSLMPRRGAEAALSDALEARCGLRLPGTGGTVCADGLRVVWMGRNQWFVEGEADLSGLDAALTDQGDGWSRLALTGPDAAAVLARLCPLDLDPGVFPPGATARSELAHMMASLIALEDGYEIRVMRSFTGTAIHDLVTAMQSVAAQAEL